MRRLGYAVFTFETCDGWTQRAPSHARACNVTVVPSTPLFMKQLCQRTYTHLSTSSAHLRTHDPINALQGRKPPPHLHYRAAIPTRHNICLRASAPHLILLLRTSVAFARRIFALGGRADSLPLEHELDVAGRDAHLLRAPSVLPEGQNFVLRRDVLGVVEASHVAEAQEDVGKAVLGS
jgi:hypothetical protein